MGQMRLTRPTCLTCLTRLTRPTRLTDRDRNPNGAGRIPNTFPDTGYPIPDTGPPPTTLFCNPESAKIARMLCSRFLSLS